MRSGMRSQSMRELGSSLVLKEANVLLDERLLEGLGLERVARKVSFERLPPVGEVV